MFRTKKKRARFSAGDSARSLKNYQDRKIVGKKSGSRKTGLFFSRILYRVSFLAFLGVVIYVLFFSPLLSVASINFKGTEKLDPALLEEAVESEIAGRYLNLAAKNNLILIREGQIKKMLLEKFKRIEDVKMRKNFPDKLEISVIEKKIMMVFCGGEKCFLVDDKGKACEEADFGSGELGENELPTLYDESGKPINLNDPALPVDFVNFILDVKNKLKQEFDIEMERDLRTSRAVSGDVRVRTREGWEIYFNRGVGVQKEIDMLKVVLAQKIEKEKRKDLEYIDLRTDNKVYYKFKTAEQSPAPAEEPKKEDKKKKS